VTGIPYFNGTGAAAQALPSASTGNPGLKILWNVVSGSGMTNF